ncbi:MAG: hypothetical protein IJX77_00025 [Ruminococcus sp.]|nr:hypothetical protein [Ruminococcus sp.]
MTMKKMFSAVVAAATLSTAAASMAFNANAETTGNPVLGTASFIGMIGAESCWGPDEVNALSTAATINGDAQYEVVWDVTSSGGTDTLQFLAIQINPAEGVDNFASWTFPDLAVTLDEVWIDNVLVEDHTVSESSINTAYTEGGPGTTRLYLRDEWVTGIEDLAGDTVITNNIRVKFTVSGLGVEGDSNVTEDPVAYTLGDVDSDGNINSLDASMVLTEYASVATNQGSTLDDTQKLASDVNIDGKIDALDASGILTYYAMTATGQTPSFG